MSDEEEPPPSLGPPNMNRIAVQGIPRLPVQLTWKGVEIYFPSVVLTTDLKQKADEALKQRIIRESQSTVIRSEIESDSENDLEAVPNIQDIPVPGGSSEQVQRGEIKVKSKISWKTPPSGLKPKCKVCQKEFGHKNLLKRHMKLHFKTNGKTKRQYGPCDKCGVRFSSSTSLNKHVTSCDVSESARLPRPLVIKIEKDDENIKTDQAGSGADGNEDVDMDNSDREPITNTINSEYPKSVKKVWGHISLKTYEEKGADLPKDNESDSDNSSHTLPLRNEYAYSSSSNSDHADETNDESAPQAEKLVESEKCLNELSFDCVVCGEQFDKLIDLQSHRKIHVGNTSSSSPVPVGPVSCEMCDRTFSSKRYLKQHWKSHKGDSKTSKKVIENLPSENIETNVSKTETLNSELMCKDCGSSYSNIYNLKRHIAVCKNLQKSQQTKGIRRYKCGICKKMFRRKPDLARHHALFHKQVNTLQCGICDESFASQAVLNEHVLADCHKNKDLQTETETRVNSADSQDFSSTQTTLPFKCDECGMGFNDKLALRRHCFSHVLAGGIPKTTDAEQQRLKLKLVSPFPSSSGSNNLSSSAEPDPPNIKAANLPPVSVLPITTGLVYSCKYKHCSHGFSHDEDLWYHIEKKHRISDELCCTQCGQNFNSEGPLSLHYESDHGIRTRITANNLDEDNSFIKVETPEFHYDEDGQGHDQDDFDYQDIQDDGVDDNSRDENDSTHIRNTDLEKLKAEILRKDKSDPFVLISSECKAAAEVALNSLDSNLNCDESDSEDEERRGESFRLDIPIQDYYTCKDCPGTKVFNNRLRYIAHLNYHAFIKKRGIEWSGEATNKGPSLFDLIPVQDKYVCERCPEPKEFPLRKAYINHLNYHESMKKKGREWAIGTKRKGSRLDDEIPFREIYTCDFINCSGRRFADRKAYINHYYYHETMKVKGREWAIGTKKTTKKSTKGEGSRPDIPIMDVYTCLAETCNNKTFPSRFAYINHVNYHDMMKAKGREWAIGGKRGRCREDIPFMDVYTCSAETCQNKKFPDRVAYINHANYHELMKAKGREWAIGTKKKSAKGEGSRPDIPIMDVYTCLAETCNNKTFPSRFAYINHVNYHDMMKAKGREWAIGGKRGRCREDIPFMDVYTCSAETCQNKTFPDRIAYINHANYHELMKAKGREWAIGRRNNKNKGRSREDIPFMDVYTCSAETCHNKTFPDRVGYINHLNYHEKMKANGREWAIGLRTGPKYFYDRVPEQDTYTCEQCEEPTVFTERIQYIAHLELHVQSRQRLMTQQGSRKRRNRRQVRTRLPYLRTYTCEICPNRTFPSRFSYINHRSYHNLLERQGKHRRIVQNKLKTPGADESGQSRTEIPMQDIYTCSVCSKTYEERSKYINHLYYHDVLEPKAAYEKELKALNLNPQEMGQRNQYSNISFSSHYRCKLCTEIKVFTDRGAYIKHLAYHKSKQRRIDNELRNDEPAAVDTRTDIPEQDSYTCHICMEEKVFTERPAFIRHLKYHKIMKDKTFQCSVCEKAFSSAWNLTAHAKSHTNDKPFVCGDCGKRFRTKDGLKKHQPTCKKVPCKYTCHCGDKFHCIKFLETHVTKYHTNVVPITKTFRCYVCNKEFVQAYDLNQHVKELHPEDYREFMEQKTASETVVKQEDEVHDVSSLIPEIVMKTEPNETQSNEPIPSADTLPSESEIVTVPCSDAPNWNFIPELENVEDNCNDEGNYYQEFLPESFEPEDVELEGCDPMADSQLGEFDSHQTSNTEHSRRKQKFTETAQYKCAYCDKTSPKECYIKVHHHLKHKSSLLPFKCIDLFSDNVTSSSFGGTFNQSFLMTELTRGRNDESNYESELGITNPVESANNQCDTCGKILSTAFWYRRHIINCKAREDLKTTAESTGRRKFSLGLQPPTSTKRLYSGSDQQDQYKCGHCSKTSHKQVYIKTHHKRMHKGLPLKWIDLFDKSQSKIKEGCEKPSKSSDTELQSKRNNDKNTSAGPKSKLKCNCCVSDTALGHLKRCVGQGCPCYSNTKKCSDGCSCKGICSNPYFKGPKPPVRSLPDLVPVSIGASNNREEIVDKSSSNSASSMSGSQYALRIMDTKDTPSFASSGSNLMQMSWDTVPYNSIKDPSSASVSERAVPGLHALPSSDAKIPSEASNEILYKCPNCPIEFSNVSSYLTHQWTHTDQKSFPCPVCNVHFQHMNQLVGHATRHHGLMCSHCAMTFKSEEELTEHNHLVHVPRCCTACMKVFPSLLDLKTHTAMHHTQCHICEQVFSKDLYLQNHYKKIHAVFRDTDGTFKPLASSSNSMQVQGEDGFPVIDLFDDEEMSEYRSASPPMPVIVDSSSIANPFEQDRSFMREIDPIMDLD